MFFYGPDPSFRRHLVSLSPVLILYTRYHSLLATGDAFDRRDPIVYSAELLTINWQSHLIATELGTKQEKLRLDDEPGMEARLRSLGEQPKIGVLHGRCDLDSCRVEEPHVDLAPRHDQVAVVPELLEPTQLQKLYATLQITHPVFENRIAKSNPPELLLFWVLYYVGNYLQQYLECSCDSSIVILVILFQSS